MEVRVGERTVAIPELNGRKIKIGTSIAARLMDHLIGAQQAIGEFARAYGEHHQLPITRERGERWGLTEADFSGGPVVWLPDQPNDDQQLMVGFTYMFARAEDDMTRLLGLAAAPRRELREAHKDGRAAEYLLDLGEDLVDDAEGDQFFELVAAAITVSRRLFDGSGGLGKLQRAWSPEEGPAETETDDSPKSSSESPPGSPEASGNSWDETDPGYIRTEVEIGTATRPEEMSGRSTG